jgi:NOL1/NOP2/sun family putative RNA methylase
MSPEQVQQLCQALETEPVVSIRLNDKIDYLTFDADTEEVPWHEDGYYLSKRPQFTLDPLFHAGCYYVQEASSMFLGEVLNQYVKRDSIVLDMCAAPGGKSTLISQYLGNEGLLVSNEVVRQRVFILSENIQKWGNGNTVVTHNYAADFGSKLQNLFDCILVDAPCSGEGMFRKDAGAVEEWSQKNVRECVARQCEILDEVWDALKPGGVLIYSTCTFNKEENEQNVKWIVEELGAEVLPIAYDPNWGIVEGQVGYHFYPHKVKGEGLYMCALRKLGAPATFRMPKTKVQAPQTKIDGEAEMRSWLKHPDRWVIRQQERFMSAYPAKYKELIEYISTQFICISTGFGIGELRGKGVVPQHSLAMLKDIKKDAFVCAALTLEQALAYLRNEALVLEGVKQGVVLVTYEGVPLGFVKNVGNHCNNLYPKEWRIRKL